MKRVIRLLSVLTVLALLAALTACSGGGGKTADISDIAGLWIENGDGPECLVVNADGTFNYNDNFTGTVKAAYGKASDGKKTVLYSFCLEDGTLWYSFSRTKDDDMPPVLHAEPDGEPWFMLNLGNAYAGHVEVSADPVSILTQLDNDTVKNESTGDEIPVAILRMTAVDENDNTLWEYTSPPCALSELDTVQYLGTYGGMVFVNEQGVYVEGRPDNGTEHHLYALDEFTGEVVWDNTDFTGASVCSAYDESSGTLYLSGYYGPDCFAVGPDGNTLWVVADIDENLWWPIALNLREDGIEIVFDGGDGNGSEGPYYGFVGYDGTAFAG